MELAQNLRYLRKKKGWTQKEVAEKIGVATGCVNYYESGKREPNIKMLIKLASLYQVSMDSLCGVSSGGNIDEYAKGFEDAKRLLVNNILKMLETTDQKEVLN